MSKNDSLFSRRAEDEIDEALSWLETIGSDGKGKGKARRNETRDIDRRAYEVLPTWLKMDIGTDEAQPPLADGDTGEGDNLSWLDSIASGLGGPIAEPPTMSWDETAIYTISEAERKKALDDAAGRIEAQLEKDIEDKPAREIDVSSQIELPDEGEEPWPPSAEQLEAAIGEVENLKEVTDPGKGMKVADLDVADDVTQIYANEQPTFEEALPESVPTADNVSSSAIDSLQSNIDIPADVVENEPLIGDDGRFVPDAMAQSEAVVEEKANTDLDKVADDVTEIFMPEPQSPLDEPTNIHGDDVESLRAAFPILESEPLKKPEAGASKSDVLELPEAGLVPPIDDLTNEPTITSSDARSPFEDNYQDIDVGDYDDALQSLVEDRTEIHMPGEASSSQDDVTQIFVPDDAGVDLSEQPLNEIAAGITEIYLPDSGVETPGLPEMENISAEVTEIFTPESVVNFPAEDHTEIFSPGEGSSTIQQDADEVTQIFVPDLEESEYEEASAEDIPDFQAQAPLDNVVEGITEIYLPDEDSVISKVTDSSLDADAADITEIFLPDVDKTPELDLDVDNAVGDARQADLTEIFVPQIEETLEVGDLLEMDVTSQSGAELTEIYLPESEIEDISSSLDTAGVTEIYLPDGDIEAHQPTELYIQNDELDIDVDALLEIAEAAPLPDLDGERTELMPPAALDSASAELSALDALETLHASMGTSEEKVENGSAEIDYVSSGEPTQLVLPQDTESVQDAAEPNMDALRPDVTIISTVPISERWRALIDLGDSADSGQTDRTQASLAETNGSQLTDDIPEDPDEAMAWLEEMVRKQKNEPETATQPDLLDEPTYISEREANDLSKELEVSKSIADYSDDLKKEVATQTLTPSESDKTAKDRGLADVTRISKAISLDRVKDPTALGLPGIPETATSADLSEELRTEFVEPTDVAGGSDELSDALMWLEGVTEEGSLQENDVTVELNQDDVARLLEEHLAEKNDERSEKTSLSISTPPQSIHEPLRAPIVSDEDFEDQPTLITEMPELSTSSGNDEISESTELDEALAWLEAFAEDDESASQPGELAANKLQKSYVEETVIPIYETERLAAHAAYAKEDFETIYSSFKTVLAKKDPLGANVVAEDVGLWVDVHPDEPKLHRLLGEAYLQLKRFEKSARAFRRVIELT